MPQIRATVRLQFHREFTLDAAIPLVAYFNRLGISHIYSSPLLKARAGSSHGYDVIDPGCINPELGGEAALERLVGELKKYDMGLLVDLVSNHMAVGGSDNPWWQNVLQWGLQSPYAHFFDIQWRSPDPLLKGQLLLPFLRAGYGEVLASGEITLRFDSQQAVFYAHYGDHRFPLYPPSYGHILRNTQNDSLLALVPAFEALERDADGWNNAKAVHRQLYSAAQTVDAMASIGKALSHYDVTLSSDNAEYNLPVKDKNSNHNKDTHAGDIHSDWQGNENLQRLHRLLELQHYRLASWSTAADDINWRRFFDINELGAIRVERPEVFAETHAKIFELIAKGWIQGLRIDHIDGLANPRAYCRKLRRSIQHLLARSPGQDHLNHFPIYIEKILAENESLAQNWQVDGTTGYDFMNQVSLLQHDPAGAAPLTEIWHRLSGRPAAFDEEVKQARHLVLASSLAGDVEMVAQGLLLVARNDIATRDLTLGALRRALLELVANFPVYRTYANACSRSPQDQIYFAEALAGARASLSETDWPILDYLDRWLGGHPLHSLPPSPIRKLRQKVLARFQQLTSPAAAKAVEDTAFYRSAALLSRNDVGFNPQNFSAPSIQFHQQNTARAKNFPNNLLATATHDHKRGEDTRARLAVISERAEWYLEKIQHWQTLAIPLQSNLADGPAPSPGDELIIYQTLLGSWPLSLDEHDSKGIQAYLERLLPWQEKSLREAKLRSNWSTPNSDYETCCRDFLTRLLTAEETGEVRHQICAAAQSLAPAAALNSLSQTLLRMTAPGVPDLYQGTEFWDFSLVDPDNRQPVDFTARAAALAAPVSTRALIDQWQNGHIKQWLIAKTLGLRKTHRDLFAQGDYQPLAIEGKQADHAIAFMRQFQGKCLIVIAPRLIAALLADGSTPHLAPATWGNTQVVIPSAFRNISFENCLAASRIDCRQKSIALSDVLADFPVAILFHSN